VEDFALVSQSASSKERLLHEATRLVQERGFGATSVNDLLAAASLKKGSLYFHFASKRELGLSVLERARAQFAEFRRAALSGETPEARLHHFFDAVLSVHRQSGFVGGCLWGNTALEMSDMDEEYSRFVAEVFDEWIAQIEAVIAAGQTEGQFRAGVPACDMARHVVSAIEGGIMQSRLRKSEEPLRSVLDSMEALLKPLSPKITCANEGAS
jgi:TetR/AcrR family transcriptional repressor of nem operon